jgi:branched-chain amino acid transport system ATP-binding protein
VSLLELDDVTVRYGAITAVRRLSLRVEEGEIVAIVGPNGAGKSSTMAAIAGLVAPQGGTISYAGESITGTAPERLARRGISLVPEGRHVFRTLSVRENLMLGTTVRRDDPSADLEEVLERFPALRRLAANPAGKLSGGEQQQLAIGRALLTRPRLLLLDEPSLGLAPVIVEQVMQVLAELRSEGVTILLVEQFAQRAMRLADRTYVMSGGTAVLEGRGEELAAGGSLEAAYLGAIHPGSAAR